MRVRRSCWLLASCASCVLGCAHGAPTAPAAASVGEIGPAAVEEDQHPSDGVLRYTGVLEEGDRVIPDDGSWADDYDVEAQAGWVITATLVSDDFDPYLWILTSDRDHAQQLASQPGTHTLTLAYTVPETGTYIVRANSNVGGEQGAYVLEVRVEPPGTETGGAGASAP